MVVQTGLFSGSSQLKETITAVRKKVQNELDKSISLVEYITLPDFGQHIILRFELDTSKTLGEIDYLESRLRNLAGRDLWVTLAGACYMNIYPPGIISELPDRLVRLSNGC